MGKVVEPGDPEWHDKSFRYGRPFTCDHCGAEGTAVEADARCDECGRKTQLAFEREEY